MSLEKGYQEKYEWLVPDGGWSHMVNVGCILIVTFTLVPISSCSLIFGPFISQFHDETSAITIVTSTFGAAYHTTGLAAYLLLRKMSFRKVGLIGAFLYCTGSFASIFVTSLKFMIISYGVLQGIGTGLLIPSALTAVNAYFYKKKMLNMALGQAIVALVNIAYPGFTRILLEQYGFRGTQAIFSALSLNLIFGGCLLQPVKWHMKKQLKTEEQKEGEDSKYHKITYSSVPNGLDSECLVRDRKHDLAQEKTYSKSLTSLSNFGSLISFPNLQRKEDKKNILLELLDLTLLKDIFYWNMTIGMAFNAIAEMNFIAILPILLNNMDFTKNNITLAMTIYFASDLAVRALLCLLAAFYRLRIRVIFLLNILSTIVVRIVFTFSRSFWWMVILTAIMGISRSLITVPIPMIIAESYSERFSSAYSVGMVVTGIVSLIMGALLGYVKYKTDSDVVVLHTVTVVCFICALFWIVEYVYKYLKTRKRRNFS